MSTRYLNRVWYCELDLDHTEKLVLLSLADQANDDGWCWPSTALTAARCSLHQDTVWRIIEKLEAKGIVTVKRRPGQSSTYQIELPEPPTESRRLPGSNHRPRVGTPPTQSRRTTDSHSGGTIKNHQRTYDKRVQRDIEEAKLNAVPMPEHLKQLIKKTS